MDVGLVDDPSYQWGPASSPVIFDDRVIVQNDRHKDSFLAAYDLATGKEALADHRTTSIRRGRRRSIVRMTGAHRSRHQCAASTSAASIRRPAASCGGSPTRTRRSRCRRRSLPATSVIVTGGYPPGGRPIYAIRPGGIRRARRRTSLAWQTDRGAPYTGTPLVYDGILYACTDNGILSAYDARTGERIYQQRVSAEAGGFSASPIAAGGRIYLASEEATCSSCRPAATFKLLATNRMGEVTMATPAAGGQHADRPDPDAARGDRDHEGVNMLRRSCLVAVVAVGRSRRRRRRRRPPIAGRQFRGIARAARDQRRRQLPGPAARAVDLRRGRRHRIVGRDRRRRRLRRRAAGELHAVNLADGKMKWKYKASADGIGESSPAVAGGLVYIGDLGGRAARRRRRDAARRVWTFKTGSEIKSSPVVSGDRVLIGSYDSQPLRARREGRQAAWKVQTEGYVHAHAGGGRRRRLHRRLRRDPARRSGSPTARRCSQIVVGRLHRARRRRSSTAAPTTAPTRTKCWRSI